ncbi:MAG TPA: hypothetical protein ENJ95_04405 [Bacteroidetes bacterium]|nr:hypothetical protein [Bacteroidota bacterium]
MNILELKGAIVELIGTANDAELLKEILIAAKIVVETNGSEIAELTKEQSLKLDRDIAESHKPENLISHEDAMKKMSRWLTK